MAALRYVPIDPCQPVIMALDATDIQSLRAGQPVILPDTTLLRQITLSFWIATLIFIAMLALIAFGKLHNTLAALLGMSAIFAVSYLGRPISEELFIFDFRGALRYIDWNVIFLIMGMMIVIAVIERTGLFQWLAYQAFRISGGRVWLLVPILMVVLSLILPYSVARWTNIIVAIVVLIFNAISLPYEGAYDNFLIVVSFVFNLMVIWYAWRWVP